MKIKKSNILFCNLREVRYEFVITVGSSADNRSLGRPGRRWENNIKLHLREKLYVDKDWTILFIDGKLRTHVSTINIVRK
jgi:hypothetical protein